MTRMEAAEMVLQQMQMLDQQVAPPFALTQQSLHFGESGGFDLPSLREIRPPPSPRARVNAPVVSCCQSHNGTSGVIVIASGANQSRRACHKWREIASSPDGSSQ